MSDANTLNINLFNPDFVAKKKAFSFTTTVQSTAILTVFCAAVYGYAQHKIGLLAAEVQNVSMQRDADTQTLAAVSQSFATKPKSTALEDEVVRVEQQVTALRQLMSTVQSADFGNVSGYSGFMRAFARQTTPGVWLTGFSLKGQRELQLDGRALHADLLPVYLDQLQKETLLKNLSFSGLTMQADETTPTRGNLSSASPVRRPSIAFSLHAQDNVAAAPAGKDLKGGR